MANLSRGLDAATILTPFAKHIADAGFVSVGRYLKSLSKVEIDTLHAAGISVWLIYETTADRALGGAAQGAADGTRASVQAQSLGTPAGTCIYATVDTDPVGAQVATCQAYAAAFNTAVVAGGYRGGLYASGAVLNGLSNLITPWLAGAMGWNGSRAYEPSGAWAVKQGPQINAGNTAHWANLDWPALSFAYDPNVIARDIGAWEPVGAVPIVEPQPQPAPRQTPPVPQGGTAPDYSDVVAAIKQLQTAFNNHGWGAGTPDGIWGDLTEAAWQKYEDAQG